ncbi:MAG: HPr kinase/phosphorylase [Leptospiraceae bacterium]|nr:HPr kinase/phosphorylase [Leptospiraceae bacterium]MCB1304000.1 HPr kinase/phosphorylase [Leptospiraceae bacterium]
MNSMEVGKLIQYSELGLRIVSGEEGLQREIRNEDVNRPGLALAGFYRNFAHDRIQVFGQGEHAYLIDCGNELEGRIKEEFFKYQFPALVFTHGNEPPDCFVTKSSATTTPLLQTTLSTHDFILNFNRIITRALAPQTSIHGVLVEVFGMGILLLGPSGIGKSETALELIERGHRLVADDMVHIRHMGKGELVGESDPMIEHHMELRGIGIVNIKDLFGVGAIRKKVQVDLVVFLEDWKEDKEYDRLGIDEQTMDILDVAVPSITLPLRPGRNIPILVETASMNHRSRRMGFHAARSLSERIHTRIAEQIDEDAEGKSPRQGRPRARPKPLMGPV